MGLKIDILKVVVEQDDFSQELGCVFSQEQLSWILVQTYSRTGEQMIQDRDDYMLMEFEVDFWVAEERVNDH